MSGADEIVTELVNKWDNRWDEFTDPQSRSELEVAIAAAIRRIEAERDKLRKLDQEAATYVESVICMRTHFTGEPPYVGWEGLGLALNEVLDERDRLAKEVVRLRAALVEIGEHDSVDTSSFVFQTAYAALDPSTPEGGGE